MDKIKTMNKTKTRLLAGLLSITIIFADVMSTGLAAQAAEVSQQASVEIEGDNVTVHEEEDSTPSEGASDEENGETESSEDQDDTDNEEPESSEDQDDTENEETGDEETETPEEENSEEETEAPAIGLPEDDESIETSESEIAAVLADDEEIIAQGEYRDEDGSDTSWVLYANGKLMVMGFGEVKGRYDRAPWDDYYEDITTAVIDVKGMKNAYNLFWQLIYLESLDVSGFDTSQITDMRGMFSGCHRLKDLDVSGFDTSSVTDMSYMFNSCRNLTSLDVSGFDTGSVTNMNAMFANCWDLTTLDVSGFDTGSVTDMNSMFAQCWDLTTLDVSGLDTGLVTDMSSMFAGCDSLTSLDLDNFDMSSVTDMSSMFDGCSSLRTLDLSNINAPSLTAVEHMFTSCPSLRTLNLSGFNAPSLTDMSGMFFNCGVRTINLSGFNAPSVTDMSNMFAWCSDLTNLNLSGFNSSSVTNMHEMFSGCSSLKTLDLSGFDTGLVTNMQGMFSGCSSLTNLNVSGFDTGSATNMDGMFSGCSSLTNLNVSGFDTSSVTTMYGMFIGCSSLTDLDVSGFDTSSVTSMGSMFSSCSSLTDLDVSGFDTGSVTDMGSMFNGCSGLTKLDLGGFDTSLVTSMGSMFNGCSGLTKLDLRNWNMGKVGSGDMFNGCRNLEVIYAPLSLRTSVPFPQNTRWSYCRNAQELTVTELPKGLTNSVLLIKNGIKAFSYGGIYTADGSDTEWILDWDGKLTVTGTGDVKAPGELAPWTFSFSIGVKTAVIEVTGMTDASRLFQNCTNLESVDLSSFETGSVTDMRRMFYNCSSLKTLDVSRFETGLVTNMSKMFSGCSRLGTLDVNGFDTHSVTDMSGMFDNCYNLEALDVNGFDTHSVTDMSGMFHFCTNLTTLDVSGFDTSSVTDMSNMFKNCYNLGALDLSGFKTGSVTDMNNMFAYCYNLEALDVSGLDTSSVTDMNNMFAHCWGLTTLDVSGFDTSSVTNMTDMFSHCSSLTELDLRDFNMGKVTDAENMLSYCESLETIYAPLYLAIPIDLPKEKSSDVWYHGGETLTQLPQGLSASVLLTRNKKAEAGSISARKRKTNYLCGETVEIDDLVVTYRRSDGSIIELAASEYQILNLNDINKDTNTPGKKELKITYTAPDGAELSTTAELMFCIGLTGVSEGSGGNEGNTTIILPDKNPVYNGSRQQPKPTVTVMIDGTPKLLSADTDYTVTYANNINAGENAVITIKGMGDYSGTARTKFTIDKAGLTIQAADVTIAAGDEMPADKEFLHEAIGLVVGDEEQLKVTPSFTKQGSEEPAVGREGVNTKEEGIYSVTLQADAGDNYEVMEYRAGRLLIAAERVAYTVTFDLMGHGTEIEIPGIRAGRLLDIDELEQKSGTDIPRETDGEIVTDESGRYVFTGWYKDKTFDAKMKWDFDTDTVQAVITLYACWVEKAPIAEDGSGLQMSIQDVQYQYYTGSAIKPMVYIYTADGSTLLKSGKDYTVKYANNTNAVEINDNGTPKVAGGTASVTNPGKKGSEVLKDIEGSFDKNLPYIIITGKGNYSETIYKNFHILPADIAAEDGSGSKIPAAGFTLKYSDQLVTNTKKDQKPFGSLKYKKAMKLGTDYEITLTAGNDVKREENATEATWIKDGGSAGTTGDGKATKYAAPVIPKGYYGTFTMTVTGKGNYTGSFAKTVIVADKDHLMKNAKITLGKNQKSVPYTDYADGGAVTLTPGYMVSYGRYRESGDTEDLYNANDIFLVTTKDGKTTKYLRADEGDFTVSYANNKAVGTATMTVTGNPERGYYGSKSVTFKITGAAFNTRNVTVVEEGNASSRETGLKASMFYTGRAITQNNVTLKPNTADVTTDTLVYGKHYTISYKNNIKKGTATMTFTAKPESGYTGSFKKTFKITPVDLSESAPVDLSESAPITIEGVKDGGHKFDNVEGIEGYGWGEENDPAYYYPLGGTVAYTREGAKPSAHIRFRRADWEGNAPDAWIILKEGTDYTVQYANNTKVAKSSVDTPQSSPIMIFKGKGNYVGTIKVIFNISEAPMEDNENITVSAATTAFNANKANDYEYQPKITVKDGKKTLSAKNDYEVNYVNCKQEDVKNYLEELKKLESSGSEKTWNDIKDMRPYAVITAKEGSGYKATGGIMVDLTIYGKKLTSSNLYVVVSEDPAQTTYTGGQLTPGVEVYYGDAAAVKAAKKDTVTDDATLTKQDGTYRLTKLAPKTETGGDGDYTVTYGANIASGKNKGSVTITGSSKKYGGSVTIKFEIKKREVYHVLYNTLSAKCQINIHNNLEYLVLVKENYMEEVKDD